MCNYFDFADTLASSCNVCTQLDFEEKIDFTEYKTITAEVTRLRAKALVAPTEEEAKNLKEQANKLKKKLPVLIPHCHFTNHHRCDEGRQPGGKPNTEPSEMVSLDFDNCSDPRQLWEEKLKDILVPLNCCLAYISPSGLGLKIIMPMPEGTDDRKVAQQSYAKLLGGIECDSTADLARCAFFPIRDNILLYRPDLLFNHDLARVSIPLVTSAFSKDDIEEAQIYADDADVNIPKADSQEVVLATQTDENAEDEPMYNGITYSRIIKKYWEVNYDGKEPKEGGRDALTYRLAHELATICGYNFELLDKVIPCYDGFPEEMKKAKIRSALNHPLREIPYQLRITLQAIAKEEKDNKTLQEALENLDSEPDRIYVESILAAFQLPSAHIKGMPRRDYGKVPAGLRETFETLPQNMYLCSIIGVGPMIGALASDVHLNVRNLDEALNLQSYIVGASGSGKSNITTLDEIWMSPWREKMAEEVAKDDAYNEEIRRCKNAKVLPKDPHAKILEIAQRTSVSKVFRRLWIAQGAVCYGVSAEMDMNNKNASYNEQMSAVYRVCWEGGPCSLDFNDTQGRIHIDHARMNLVLCGTLDALRRLIKKHLNGEVSRIIIGLVPDNTFTYYQETPKRKPETVALMKRLASLVMLMQGDIRLKKLEDAGIKWSNDVVDRTLEDGDTAMASQRFRIPTSAERTTCGFMLLQFAYWLIQQIDNRKPEKRPTWVGSANTAEEYLLTHPDAVSEFLPKFQNEAWITFMLTLCDYIMANTMMVFRDNIEKEQESNSVSSVRVYNTINKTIFESLGETFTFEEVVALKDNKKNAAKCMISNLIKQGLVRRTNQKGVLEKTGKSLK